VKVLGLESEDCAEHVMGRILFYHDGKTITLKLLEKTFTLKPRVRAIDEIHEKRK
jgi:hypothetical protein